MSEELKKELKIMEHRQIISNYEGIQGLLSIAAKDNDLTRDLTVYAGSLEARIKKLENTFKFVDQEFKKIDTRLSALEEKMNNDG